MNNYPVTNAMSVDVEDYFQVYAFESIVKREQWNSFALRVEANCDRIFRIFDDHNVKATFFVLGWVAERCPVLVKRIVALGHELASHGYDHRQVHSLTPRAFRDDVTRTKAMLEDLGGVAVNGYRAPSYSIGEKNFWALQILAETGHRYSSSIYPIAHDIYGMPEAPRFTFQPIEHAQLIEVPVTTFRLGERNYPSGGGGYFRLLPYALTRWAIRRVNRRDGQAAVFYFHPWEIDPGQPRQSPLNFKTRIRHYVNQSRMAAKIETLCRDFRWDRMDRVFLQQSSDVGVWHPQGFQALQHAD